MTPRANPYKGLSTNNYLIISLESGAGAESTSTACHAMLSNDKLSVALVMSLQTFLTDYNIRKFIEFEEKLFFDGAALLFFFN